MSIKGRTPPAQQGEHTRSGPPDTIIVVYVCENFQKCGGYYGSSSMPPLEKEAVIAPVTAKDAGQIRHMRSQCPICGGNRIRRYARLVPQEEVSEAERKIRSR